MVAEALTNTTYMVLDRPNPITGLNAFGPVLDQTKYNSYVGRRAIAQAHGMTSGELAKMFVGEKWIQEAANGSELALEVVQMEGWERWMTWADTGLPWVIPSPSMHMQINSLLFSSPALLTQLRCYYVVTRYAYS